MKTAIEQIKKTTYRAGQGKIKIEIQRSSYTDAPEGLIGQGDGRKALNAITEWAKPRRCLCCGAPEGQIQHD